MTITPETKILITIGAALSFTRKAAIESWILFPDDRPYCAKTIQELNDASNYLQQLIRKEINTNSCS